MTCGRCGSENVAIERRPSGPHYADRRCQDCRSHCGFEPWPTVNPDDLILPEPPEGNALAKLAGTEKQIAWARSLRVELLRTWGAALPPDLMAALRTITDSSWWIAQRGRRHDAIKWPNGWRRGGAA